MIGCNFCNPQYDQRSDIIYDRTISGSCMKVSLNLETDVELRVDIFEKSRNYGRTITAPIFYCPMCGRMLRRE